MSDFITFIRTDGEGLTVFLALVFLVFVFVWLLLTDVRGGGR